MKLALALTVYIGAIVAANVMAAHYGLINVGFGLLVPAGTFAAGFALLARDFVHRYGGVMWALGGIAVGGLLSFWLSTPGLAVASAAAFTAAELVDLSIYSSVSDHLGFAPAILASNLVSAPVDTVAFLWLAGFPLTWNAIAGQLVGKLIWATLVPLALYLVGQSALLRQPVEGRA